METKITNKAIQRHLDALYCEVEGRPQSDSLLYRTRMAYAMAAAFGTKNQVAGIEKEWRQMAVEMGRMKEQVKLEDSTAVKTTLKPVLAAWARLTNLRAEMPDSFTITKAPGKCYTDAWERETCHGGGWSRIIVLMNGVMSWWQAYYEKAEEAATDKRREASPYSKELDSDEANEIIEKGISAQLIKRTANGLKWNDTKQLLAYFAEKVSDRLGLSKELSNGVKTTAWKPFEALFREKDIKGAKQNWMRLNMKFEPTGFEKVDALL